MYGVNIDVAESPPLITACDIKSLGLNKRAFRTAGPGGPERLAITLSPGQGYNGGADYKASPGPALGCVLALKRLQQDSIPHGCVADQNNPHEILVLDHFYGEDKGREFRRHRPPGQSLAFRKPIAGVVRRVADVIQRQVSAMMDTHNAVQLRRQNAADRFRRAGHMVFQRIPLVAE